MNALIQDVRYALRQWKKSSGFVASVVATLALGIGATTAMFSVVYGVLLKPLPFEQPNHLLDLHELDGQGKRMNFADPNFDDVREQSHVLEGMAGYIAGVESATVAGEPRRAAVASVSRDFFQVMRVRPILGRLFLPEEQHVNASPVALVSYKFWRHQLGAAADLSSQKLAIDGQPAAIIGVLPDGFDFPEASEIWTPHETYMPTPSRTAHNQQVVARFRNGVTLEEVRAELNGIAQRLKQQFGQEIDMTGVAAVPLRDSLTGDVQKPLWILLGAVSLLLLIACSNVTSLLLARQVAREHEAALRVALGAGSKHMMRQYFAESLLLTVPACALGGVLAATTVTAISSFASQSIPRWESVGVNLPVLTGSISLSVFIAVGMSLLATARARKGDVQQRLRGGARSHVGSNSLRRVGPNMVVGQVAITLMLLVAAGLLGRSLQRVLAVDPGFRSEQVLTMDVSLPEMKDKADYPRRSAQLGELIRRLQAIPGVVVAGGTSGLPLSDYIIDGKFIAMQPNQATPQKIDDLALLFRDKNSAGYAEYLPVDPGYFTAMSIPLLQGRLFQDSDDYTAPQVAIVSASLVRKMWPQQNVLGRRIEFGNMDGDLRPMMVVGVVKDVRVSSLESPADPAIYVPLAQRPQTADIYSIALRCSVNPGSIVTTARRVTHDLMPEAPVIFHAMVDRVNGTLSMRRFVLWLAGGFALCALLLAVTGLYGVMAYAVGQRRREMGVRIALGATPSRVLSMVLGQGLRLVLLGSLLGALGSLGVTHILESQLFEIKGYDPPTLVIAVVFLMATAAAACWIPARRAAHVEPVTALREE